MMDHDCHSGEGFRVTFPGPFQHHEVVVRGWSVPFLKASLQGEHRVRLILDERFGIELTTQEAERLIPFLANAIAVALGYGAHPREDTKVLPERTPHAAPRRVISVELADEAA